MKPNQNKPNISASKICFALLCFYSNHIHIPSAIKQHHLSRIFFIMFFSSSGSIGLSISEISSKPVKHIITSIIQKKLTNFTYTYNISCEKHAQMHRQMTENYMETCITHFNDHKIIITNIV